MTDDTLLIDVLRAAGHEDAADLATKLMARNTPAEPAEPAAPVVPRPPQTEEELRRAEGQSLLDAMRRDLGAGR